MKLSLIILMSVLYLGLLTGCDEQKSATHPEVPSVTTTIDVATEPVGVGLGAIGAGIVVAAWIVSLMGGRHE
jgi:hypothetical protein